MIIECRVKPRVPGEPYTLLTDLVVRLRKKGLQTNQIYYCQSTQKMYIDFDRKTLELKRSTLDTEIDFGFRSVDQYPNSVEKINM